MSEGGGRKEQRTNPPAAVGQFTSEVEVTHISTHGIWLLSEDEEYFLPYDEFPWFKDSDWVTETGEDGEVYAYPPALNAVGFFEDFFDGVESAVSTFWRVVNQWLTVRKEPCMEMNGRCRASL